MLRHLKWLCCFLLLKCQVRSMHLGPGSRVLQLEQLLGLPLIGMSPQPRSLIYFHLTLLLRKWKDEWPLHLVCVCVCVCQSLSHVQLCDPIDCSPPGSSVQARILEWVGIPFSRSARPGSPALQADSLPSEPPGMSTQYILFNKIE